MDGGARRSAALTARTESEVCARWQPDDQQVQEWLPTPGSSDPCDLYGAAIAFAPPGGVNAVWRAGTRVRVKITATAGGDVDYTVVFSGC